MLDFNFFNPTQIVFGQKRLDELDNLVPEQAKVMIIYGGTAVKKFGVIDRGVAPISAKSPKLALSPLFTMAESI